MTVDDIKNIESEAGVIASVILKPELTFYSEQLLPNHFTDEQKCMDVLRSERTGKTWL